MKNAFMVQAIAAHDLKVRALEGAASLLWNGATYWDAKKIAAEKPAFEAMDVLIPDDSYAYPPPESLAKSFEKWLALQKHDVKTVVSLYNWERAAERAQYEVLDKLYFLKEEYPESLQEHVTATVKLLEEREEQIAALRRRLRNALDVAKTTPKHSALHTAA